MSSLFTGGKVLHWIPVTKESKDAIGRMTKGHRNVHYTPSTSTIVEIALQHAIKNDLPPSEPFRPVDRIPARLLTDYDEITERARKTGALMDSAIRWYTRARTPVLQERKDRSQYIIGVPRRLLFHQAMYAFRDGHDILDDLTATIEEAMLLVWRNLAHLDGKMVWVDVPISKGLYEQVREVAWKKAKLDVDTLIANSLDDLLRVRSNPTMRWQR